MITTIPQARRAIAVRWNELDRWDVKYFTAHINSSFSIVRLDSFIREHRVLVKPFEFPNTTFRILGVTNTGGIFHAYDCLGKKINQHYQRVDAGDFAYNPYRVNVGSIGIVPLNLGGNYISPAYVVFTTDATRLLPEYLLLILKSDWFNPELRAATAGSVRQNLTFDLLRTLKIPLPSLPEQKAIVTRWRNTQDEIYSATQRVKKLEGQLPLIVYRELGTPPPLAEKPHERYLVMLWEDLQRWSFNYVSHSNQGLLGFAESKYLIGPLGKYITETMNGYCIKPVSETTPYKMLKLSALNPSGLDLNESKFVKVSERIADKFSLCKNDILICRSNAFEYVAKSAFVREDQPGYLFPDIIIRIRVNENLLPEYVTEVIQTPLGRSYFQVNSRRAVGGMWKISADDIQQFPIPIPPITVQKQIIKHISIARAKIAQEYKAVQDLTRKINTDIETQICGNSSSEEN